MIGEISSTKKALPIMRVLIKELYNKLYVLFVEQDVVDCSDINSCDETVAVNIAGGYEGLIAVKQVVVDTGHIGSGHCAIAVHVARNVNNNLLPTGI